jgi:hypothetical protein
MKMLALPVSTVDEEDTKSASSGQSNSEQSFDIDGKAPSSSGPSSSDEKDLRDRIIKGEEKNVQRARWCVCVSFLVIAVSVTTAVYFFSDAHSLEIEVSISGVASDEQN